jgi:hypothetical protein
MIHITDMIILLGTTLELRLLGVLRESWNYTECHGSLINIGMFDTNFNLRNLPPYPYIYRVTHIGMYVYCKTPLTKITDFLLPHPSMHIDIIITD